MLTAELGSAFPVEGGPYEWARLAFGRCAGSVTAILYWLSNPTWIGGTLTASTIAALDALVLHKPLGTTAEIIVGLAFVWVTVAIAIVAFRIGKWGPNIGTFVNMTATTVGQTTFANNPSTTIATNGYNGGSATGDAPSAGTSESWTVTSSGSFPAASSSATPTTGFHIADPAAMAEGTALAAPGRIKSGAHAVIEAEDGRIRRRIARSEDDLLARLPSASEKAALELPDGMPVVSSIRTIYDDETAPSRFRTR